MKFVLIGSVISSECALEIMLRKGVEISMVFSLDEAYSKNVSTYRPIHELAEKNNVPYKKFKNINDKENVELLRRINPDYIFVIGLSQLVGKDILQCAKKNVIGYHPAPLPKFRGRAAIVWQILLGIRQTAVTLFCIDEGMDSGDIICQEDYEIGEKDYAEDVLKKCRKAALNAISKGIDLLLDPNFKPTPQNDSEATYLLRRAPEDGKINWNDSGENIEKLIRAVSRPYPGAFASYEDKGNVIFWRAEFTPDERYFGFNGQIISKSESHVDILCRDGVLRVSEFEIPQEIKLVVGHKFN